MDFSTKYCIIIYVIILLLLYLWKPFLFKITDENPDKKKKLILFSAMIIIVAIISIYIKIMFEWFL
jgi:uncharacterized membrane protein